MYRLFCDSNCELWYTRVKELGLDVIKMPYTLDGQEYFYDMGEKTDFKGFFEKMRQGAVPKTSALNEFAYLEYFEPILKSGMDIYYITFSHAMSATFESMKSAIALLKEKYPEREIRYKDTKNITLGSGMSVYYAALEYKKGATMDELDSFLNGFIPHVSTYFVVEDLTYLYRGGRVSGLSKVFGNLLGVKPVLHFDETGKIVNIEKVKGFKKALVRLKEYLRDEGEDAEKYKVYILQADAPQVAEEFAAELREEFGLTNVEIQPVGPVIGAHCGPGTIGLVFHGKANRS